MLGGPIPEVPDSDVSSPIKPFDMTPSPDKLTPDHQSKFDFNLESVLRPSQTNVDLSPSRNSPRRSPHSRHRGNPHNFLDEHKGKNYILKSYNSEKNYQNQEQEKYFADIDPHIYDPAMMDSFENFLRTNNKFDYSISGLFDEQGNGSSRQIGWTDRSGERILGDPSSDKVLGDNYLPEPMHRPPDHLETEEQPVDHITFSRSSGFRLQDSSSISKVVVVDAPGINARKAREEPPATVVLNKFNSFRDRNFPLLKDKSVLTTVQNDLAKRPISYQQPETAAQPSVKYRLVSNHTEPVGTYTGYMLDEKKHGLGTLHLNDGGKYEGDWKDNSMSGIGKLTFQNGAIGYEGGFLQNKPCGFGKLVNLDLEPAKPVEELRKAAHTRSQAKQFSGSILIDSAESSARNLVNEEVITNRPAPNSEQKKLRKESSQEKSAVAEIDYKDLGKHDKTWTEFEGIFVAGRKEGPGKLRFISGEEFVGHFLNDKAHGTGYFKTAHKETIFGIWQENVLQTILCKK